MAEPEWTNLPTCHHCGYENQDWFDGINGAESFEWDCRCGRKLKTKIMASYDFVTEDDNGSED